MHETLRCAAQEWGDHEATRVEGRAEIRPGSAVRVRERPGVVVDLRPYGPRGRRVVRAVVRYVDGLPPCEETLFRSVEESWQEGSTLDAIRTPPMPLEGFLTAGNEWIRDNLIPFPGASLGSRLGWGSANTGRGSGFVEAPLAPAQSEPAPDPHQLVVLEKALQRRNVRLLLADEPGLGKTAQAALVAAELVLRRRAFRILVLCPPGLRRNWQTEMRRFAGLDFEILDRLSNGSQGNDPTAPFGATDRAIASFHWLKQPHVLRRFLQSQQQAGPAGPWDLLVVDEAHHLVPPTGARSQLHEAMGQVVSWFPHRLFLTATPHSGYSDSLLGLLQLLDPLRFQKTASPTPAMRQAMGEVVVRRTRSQIKGEDMGPGTRIRLVRCEHNRAEQALQHAWRKAAKSFVSWASPSGGEGGSVSLLVQVLHKRLLSSLPAFRHSFQSWASAVVGAQEEAESERKTSGRKEPDCEASEDQMPRFAAPAPQLAQLARRHNVPVTQRIREVQQALEACSDTSCAGLGGRLQAAAEWLLRHLSASPREKILVFSEFADTTQALTAHLLQQGLHENQVQGLDSSIGESRRERVLKHFSDPQHPLRVLVTTDVAAEGLNLQEACRCVLHLDLPWNPGRLAQRTGRVQRRGQRRLVAAAFVVGDTPEEKAFLGRLAGKEKTTAADLGPNVVESQLPPSLGPSPSPHKSLFPQPAATCQPGHDSGASPSTLAPTPRAVCRDPAPQRGVEWAMHWRTLLGPPSSLLPLAPGSWSVGTLPGWRPEHCWAALLALARWLALDRCDGWLMRLATPLWFRVHGKPDHPLLHPPCLLAPSALRRLAAHLEAHPASTQRPVASTAATAVSALLDPLGPLLQTLQREGRHHLEGLRARQHRLLVQGQHGDALTLATEQSALPPATRLRREQDLLRDQRQKLRNEVWLFPADRLAATRRMQLLEQQLNRASSEALRLQAVNLLDPRTNPEAAAWTRARMEWVAPPILSLEGVALLLPDSQEVGR